MKLVWVAAYCLYFIFIFQSVIHAQYGFGIYPDSFYSNPEFGADGIPNPFNTFVNATQSDEYESAFSLPIIEPSIVNIREDLWSSGSAKGYTYERYDMFGSGSFWQIVTGQPSVYIDLRQNPKVSPSSEDLKNMGVKFEKNGTITFSLTYSSQIDEVEVIHAHGILGGWWTDGVPYLNTPTIKRGETQTLDYNIHPQTNSGTYFIHSHVGFNSMHGVSAPLVIQYNVSSDHPFADILNDDHIQEIMFYAEDWCLQFTNIDDALDVGGKDGDKQFGVSLDPYICQNPYLAMRALYGEWNSHKGSMFLGNSHTNNPPPGEGILHQCQNGTIAPEFGSAFFLVNDRSYIEAYKQYVEAGSYARLRVINGARMSNFLLNVPEVLQPIIIAIDGSYVNPISMEDMKPTSYQMWVGSAQRVDILLKIPDIQSSWNIVAMQEAPNQETDSPEFKAFEISMTAGITIYSTIYPPNNNGIPPNATATGMLSLNPEWLIEQEKLFTVWPPSLSLNLTEAKQIQLSLTGYNGIFGMNFKRGLEFPPTRSFEEFLSNFDNLEPLAIVHQGDVLCINMTSYNWDTHSMHLHGHKFQVREIDGIQFSGAFRDTVFVPAGNCHSVNICFQANQTAGSFGLHCHMIIHEMSGMFSVIQYDNGVGIQGINSDVNPPDNVLPVCSSSDDTWTKLKIGLSLGLVLGILLILSVGANIYFYRSFGGRQRSLKETQAHIPMTQQRDSLSLNN